MAEALERWKPNTGAVRYMRYSSLEELFKWLTEEGEVPADPMVRIRPPAVPQVQYPSSRTTTCETAEDLRGRHVRGPTRRGHVTHCTFIESGSASVRSPVSRRGRRLRRGRGLRGGHGGTGLAGSQGRAGPRLEHTAPFAPSPCQLAFTVTWAQGGHDRERHRTDARRAMRPDGLGQVRPHEFHHTAAHTWLAAGGPKSVRCGTSAGAAARCCPDMEPSLPTPPHAVQPARATSRAPTIPAGLCPCRTREICR